MKVLHGLSSMLLILWKFPGSFGRQGIHTFLRDYLESYVSFGIMPTSIFKCIKLASLSTRDCPACHTLKRTKA